MDPDELRRTWDGREGAYSPTYYAHHGPDDVSEAIGDLLIDAVARDAPILELGCGCGRHLAHLRERGFETLHGIDVNDEAFETMGEVYPGLAEAGTFHADAIEAVVPEFDDDAFDVVYSVETLQHVHPDEAWVFDDVARIAADRVLTVENEGWADSDDRSGIGTATGGAGAEMSVVDGELPLYYRDWEDVFTGRGFEQIACRPDLRERHTLRAFRLGE